MRGRRHVVEKSESAVGDKLKVLMIELHLETFFMGEFAADARWISGSGRT